jgi:hypothetical protein
MKENMDTKYLEEKVESLTSLIPKLATEYGPEAASSTSHSCNMFPEDPY